MYKYHPTSMEQLNLFDVYTKRFSDIKLARVYIKHGEIEKLKVILDGALCEFLDGSVNLKDLSNALKTVINSVYGLTSASFDNPFKDSRNVDNIVAKRGALFMINLKHEVEDRGYIVAHIKTDSIKIPEADNNIIDFVNSYGKAYGYKFEHEATYDRMCLVNDAVYIAKYASKEKCESLYGYIPDDNNKHPLEWTATGTQFAVPFVFKTLFSKEKLTFEDLCVVNNVQTSLYLDMNENLSEIGRAHV